MWFTLETTPWIAEMSVCHSCCMAHSVDYVKAVWSRVEFHCDSFLWALPVWSFSVDESEVLKSPTYFCAWAVPFLVSHSVCFVRLGTAASSPGMSPTLLFTWRVVSLCLSYHLHVQLLVPWNWPCESWEDALCRSLVPLAGNIFSPFLSFNFREWCLHWRAWCFIDSKHQDLLFFNPSNQSCLWTGESFHFHFLFIIKRCVLISM